MKIKVLIILFMLFSSNWAQAQFVVEAPVLETITAKQSGILGAMSVTMTTIKRVEQRVEQLKEAAGWIEKLRSMQEFIQLLENTACLARDLNVELEMSYPLVGRRASCFNEFKYQVNINQLRYVVDVVNVVLTDGFNMDRSGRMEAYENALSAFREAHLGLGELSVSMNRIIQRHEANQQYKDELMIINDFTRWR